MAKQWATVSPREQIRQRYFPDVQLTTHEGRRVRLYEDLIKDRIVVMNFMYAHCQGVCIPVTANLQRVQKLLGDRVGRDIFMYSFTLKPKLDSPDVLKEYAARFRAGPGWSFLTGEANDLELVRRRMGFVDPDPSRDSYYLETNPFADRMGQRHLPNLGREAGALGAPIGKARPETVHRQVAALHSAQRHQQRHVGQGRFMARAVTQVTDVTQFRGNTLTQIDCRNFLKEASLLSHCHTVTLSHCHTSPLEALEREPEGEH